MTVAGCKASSTGSPPQPNNARHQERRREATAPLQQCLNIRHCVPLLRQNLRHKCVDSGFNGAMVERVAGEDGTGGPLAGRFRRSICIGLVCSGGRKTKEATHAKPICTTLGKKQTFLWHMEYTAKRYVARGDGASRTGTRIAQSCRPEASATHSLRGTSSVALFLFLFFLVVLFYFTREGRGRGVEWQRMGG